MISSVHIGDRVVVHMDKEARAWGRAGPADGTLGTVMGHTRYLDYVPRFGLGRHAHEAGIYERNGTLRILFDGETEERTGLDYDVRFVDPELGKLRHAEYHAYSPNYTEREDYFQNRVRIRDLPDTDFWEGDLVEIVGRDFYRSDELVAHIAGIEWQWERVPYRVDWVEKATGEYGRAGLTYVDGDKLRLIERGNVWREAHGQPLVFRSLKEEVAYAEGTGRTKEVRNPSSENYAWTKDEALKAISEGIGHGFSLSSGFFGGEGRISVTRFTDADLGERVRQTTLRGFEIA